MRMVDMLGNGYITAAVMVASRLHGSAGLFLALAAIAVATVVLELMFNNSARLSGKMTHARIWLKQRWNTSTVCPLLRVTGR